MKRKFIFFSVINHLFSCKRPGWQMLFKIAIFVIIVSAIGSYFMIKYGKVGEEIEPSKKQDEFRKVDHKSANPSKFVDYVHLATVVCGDRLDEAMTMIKSAHLFTKMPLYVHIVAENHLHQKFHLAFKDWPVLVNITFFYTLHELSFPFQNAEEWKRLYKLCGTQRLFFPTMFVNVDAVLYVDIDALFLTPIDDVFRHLHQFNASQISSLTAEHEDAGIGWYNRFARHPYYGETGLNSGVMLMNLTRMRSINWESEIQRIFMKYKMKITWGDQDIVNIYFGIHPERLYLSACDYNYRPDHCMYLSNCEAAEKRGIHILHGNRGVFHNNKQPSFKAVYQAFYYHKFGDNMTKLVDTIKRNMKGQRETMCSKVEAIFYKNLENITMNL